jgi:hypothetical protein
MPRSALLAGAAAATLILGGSVARATTRMPAASAVSAPHVGSAVQPAVVMFELAIVRMRMLNTLTELIRTDHHAIEARRW